jgi:hypothetical protein
VEVDDRLHVLVREVGDEAGDAGLSMAPGFATWGQGNERVEEAREPGQDAAEEKGIDLGVGQELFAAGGKPSPHG